MLRRYHTNKYLWPKSGRRNHRGTTMVEFSIVAGLFMLLMFAIIDLAMLGFINMTMQNAVREGTRYAITGRSDLDPDSEGDRRKAVLSKIKQHSMGFYDQVTEDRKVTVKDIKGNDHSGTMGTAGQIIVVSIDGSWPLMTPLVAPFFDQGQYDFTVSATMKNENY
jgi:Flp pilus assembly protein TadG